MEVDGVSQATVTVEDTGIGISQEMLPRIFDLFTQADQSLDRSSGGLGVGLTLARSIVELHGGTISAYSAGLGLGSQFVVKLPLATAERAPNAGPSDKSQTVPEGLRILVVDDNRDSAIGLQKLLSLSGYEVEVAHDGHSALELVRIYAPRVVLLDIGLPGLHGYEVAKRVREEVGIPKPSVMIAISGYGQEEDHRRSHEVGFDHHLVKPVDFNN